MAKKDQKDDVVVPTGEVSTVPQEQEVQPVPQEQKGQNHRTDERPMHRSEWVDGRMLVTSFNGEAQTYLDMILATGQVPKDLPDIQGKDLICIRADWKGSIFRSTLHEGIRTALSLKKALESTPPPPDLESRRRHQQKKA